MEQIQFKAQPRSWCSPLPLHYVKKAVKRSLGLLNLTVTLKSLTCVDLIVITAVFTLCSFRSFIFNKVKYAIFKNSNTTEGRHTWSQDTGSYCSIHREAPM